MNFLKLIFSIIFMAVIFTACKDDIDSIQFVDYKINVLLPDDGRLLGKTSKGLTVNLKNVNTNASSTFTVDDEGNVAFTNLIGVYNVSIEGSISYIDHLTNPVTGAVRDTTIYLDIVGSLENELFTQGSNKYVIKTSIKPKNVGWVIKEMYTASTKTLNGGSLRFDQFIEIYNNTDSVMYADGLAIGETEHQTTSGENIYAKDMGKKAFLYAFYSIPGKTGGKSVPVQPGKSIVIAPQPIDHRPNNSLDLRTPISDYQWFDAYGSGQYSVDVPEVPNLVRYYSSSLSVWVVTVQMNRGFVLVKVPQGIDMGQFVASNTDRRLNNAGSWVITVGVPNEYIVDAVDLGYKDNFYRKSLDISLDLGHSYTLSTYNGKSIRRKIERVEPDGRVVYQDTNNSTYDFWTSRTPAPKKFPTDDEISHE